jgi:hypothetical protein
MYGFISIIFHLSRETGLTYAGDPQIQFSIFHAKGYAFLITSNKHASDQPKIYLQAQLSVTKRYISMTRPLKENSPSCDGNAGTLTDNVVYTTNGIAIYPGIPPLAHVLQKGIIILIENVF